MSITKKIFLGIGVLILSALAYGFYFGLQYAYIGSSYNAKTVCSCMFVSGRDLSSIKAEDLYAVPYSNISVDEQNKTVSADIYGLAKTKAIYRKGLGCTLVNELSEEEIRKQPGVPVAAAQAPDNLQWADSTDTSVDKTALKQAVEDAFAEADPKNIKRTRAVVILHKGKIIAEKYAANIPQGTPLLGWSMTKSVTSTLIGLLVKDRKIDIKKPAPVSEWASDARNKITTDHLLRMSSGLAFEENYAAPSDATRMLFRARAAGEYAIQSKPGTDPDKVWSYSSGTTNILQEIIRRQFKTHADYLAFPHVRLFQKLGMSSAVIEPDASGTYIGSSFMYASARDWARYGQFYLQDGVWNGERLLPEGWVNYSSTETPHSDGRYAAQFWVNHQDKTFPQDAFFADGFEGQFVTVVPSKDLVVVRLGCTPGSGFNHAAFIKSIVKCLE